MNKSKEDIIGKVKYESLEKLFNMGDLTHPDKLTKTITDVMKVFNDSQYEAYENRSFTLASIFNFRCDPLKEYPVFKRESEFIQAIRSRKIMDVCPQMDDNSIVNLWHKIQDIRVILNLKCVAKRSQSNNVMAGSVTLLTIERVLDNQQEYLDL